MCRFVPRWGRRYLLRNHQKLALADEARVIIGGFNIEDNYFGTAERAGVARPGLLCRGAGGGASDRLFRCARSPGRKTSTPPLRSLRALLSKWSEPEGATRWLFGGPTRKLSPWARAVRDDLRRGRSGST